MSGMSSLRTDRACATGPKNLDAFVMLQRTRIYCQSSRISSLRRQFEVEYFDSHSGEGSWRERMGVEPT